MLDYLHNPGCGKVAFRYDVDHVAANEVIEARKARHLDGSGYIPGEKIRCGSCGDDVVGLRTSNFALSSAGE